MGQRTIIRLFGLIASLLLIVAAGAFFLPVAHAASFTVDTTADTPDGNLGDGICADAGGACSLRAAIQQANASAGPDIIGFNIPGVGAQVIDLGSVLPNVTQAVTIDGSTQPGYGGTPLIVVDADGVAGTILTVASPNVTLRALRIANASGTALYLQNADNAAVDTVDLRWTKDAFPTGYGLQVQAGSDNVILQGVRASTRDYGLYVITATDMRVYDSEFASCNTGLYMRGVTAGTLPGGVDMAGNDYTGSNTGLYLYGMANLVISDGSVPGTNIDVTLGGITHTLTSAGGGGTALYLYQVDNTTVSNIDLSWTVTGGQFGYGLRAESSMDNLRVQNITATNRQYGVYVVGGSDLRVLNSNLAENGSALYVQSVTANTLPGGILVAGNAYTTSANGISLYNMNNLTISDGSVPGTNVNPTDGGGAHTLNTTTGYALRLQTTDNVRVENVDLSASTIARSGNGLYIDGGVNDRITVRNVTATHRGYGVYIYNATDVQVFNCNLADNNDALYLYLVTAVSLPNAVQVSGNDYSNSNNGVYLGNINNLTISDGSIPGTNVNLTNSGGVETLDTNTGTALHLRTVDNVRVEALDLSFSLGGRTGSGVYIDGSSNDIVTIQNLVASHRGNGVYYANGTDLQVLNNDLSDCNQALYLSNVTANTLPEPIQVAGNDYRDSSNGVRISGVAGMIVSEGSIPGTNVNVTDGGGVETLRSTNGTALYLQSADNLLVEALDLTWAGDATRRGYGLQVDSGSDNVTIQNLVVNNRQRGIYVSGGTDVRVRNNDLRNNSGSNYDTPSLYIGSVGSVTLPGGVQVYANDYTGSDVGVTLWSLRNLVVSDGSAPGTNVDLTDSLGNETLVTSDDAALYLYDVDNSTIRSLTLSWTGDTTRRGYGIYCYDGMDNTIIRNVTATNRSYGLYMTSNWGQINHDLQILDNDFSNNGQAMYLYNIQRTALPGGIRVSGNTYAGSANGVSLYLINDSIISDGSFPGTNIDLTDGSGVETLQTVSGYALRLQATDNITVTNMDLTWTEDATRRGYGLQVDSGSDNLGIQNLVVNNRLRGIYVNGGSNVRVRNNNLRNNSGSSYNEPALYIASVTAGTLRVSGNDYTGSDYGVSLMSLQNLVVSDGSAPGTNVNLTDGLGNHTLTRSDDYPLFLYNVDDSTFQALNLSWTGDATRRGYGIYSQYSSDRVTIRNITATNRNYGVYSDYMWTPTSQDLRVLDSNLGNNNWAIYLRYLQANTLPGGVNIAGNDYTGCANGLYFYNMQNLVVSDGTAVGTNVNLTNGGGRQTLTSVSGTALQLDYNIDNLQVSNLDLSWRGGTSGRSGYGLYLSNSSNNGVIINNVIANNRTYGMYLQNHTGLSATCSTLLNDNYGLRAYSNDTTAMLTNNHFQGNTWAVYEDGTGTLNAENNYWGAPNGPSNLGGSGDAYNGSVDASPWLAAKPACSPLGDFVVTTTSDTAGGNTANITALLLDPGPDEAISLREAILAANNTAGIDIIPFNIGGGGVQTIVLGSALPAVTDPVIIDGTSQPGFTGAPLITVNANGLAGTILDVTAGGSVVHSVNIANAPGTALRFNSVTGDTVYNVDVSWSGAVSGTGLDISNSTGVNVYGLTADSRATGVGVAGSSSVTLGCSALTNNTTGLNADATSSAVQMAEGLIQGNGTGINNSAGGLLNAENSYWGAPDGPGNLGGSGDSYSGNVDASPFLTAVPQCMTPTSLVVTTGEDVNDGNTSSVANLIATPGPDGAISLREAIIAANNTAGPNTIGFDLGFGAKTIYLVSALPNVTGAITIDGSTQPGFAGTILITVDANYLGGTILTVQAANSTLNDFAIANASGTALYLNNADNSLVDHLDLSWGSSRSGIGLYLVGTDGVTVRDTVARNRRQGIYANGGTDLTVLDNDLRGSGQGSSEYALDLRGLNANTLPGGVNIAGNDFTGCGYGAGFYSMRNLVISDGSVGGTNVNLTDGSGNHTLNTAEGWALYMNNVDNSSVQRLDLSWTGSYMAQLGYGLYASGCDTLLVKDMTVQDRQRGLYVENSTDARVLDNNLYRSGSDASNPALYINNVTANTLPGGVLVTGNAFLNSNTAVRLDNMRNLNISDGSLPGSNVVFSDTGGLNTTSQYPLYLGNVDNSVVDNLLLSYSGWTRSGYGLYAVNWCDNLVVRNNTSSNRSYGAYVSQAYDLRLYDNNLASNAWALYIYDARQTSLPGGVVVYGNVYTGSADGVQLGAMRNLVISDGSIGGTNVNLTDGSGNHTLNAVPGWALYMNNVDDSSVRQVDLSWNGAYPYLGSGLYGNGCDRLLVQDVDVQDRYYYGMQFSNGSDIRVLNNNFSRSGWAPSSSYSALYMDTIVGGTLPGSVLVTGNTFLNSAVTAQFRNMRSLNISDGSLPGSNVLFLDTDGVNTASQMALYLYNIDNSVVDNLYLTYPYLYRTGYGLYAYYNNQNLIVRNSTATNRSNGVYISQQNYDIQVYDNDLRNNNQALYVYDVRPTALPGGIVINRNDYTGSNNGVYLGAMSALVISEGSIGGTNVDLTNAGGVETLPSDTGTALRLDNVDNTTVQNLDLSWTGAVYPVRSGTGLYASAGCDNLLVQNLAARDRQMGMYFSGGSNVRVLNNDLSGSGASSSNPALYMTGVSATGLQVNNNTFADADTAVRLDNMNGLTISDGSVGGSQIILADTCGVKTAYSYPFYLYNIDNSTVDNLDLSWDDPLPSGYGLYAYYSLQNVTIRNSDMSNRSYGAYIYYQCTNVDVRNNDFSGASTWGLYEYQNNTGVEIADNNFTDCINGIYLQSMGGLNIGPGPGLNTVGGTAVHLYDVTNSVVDGLDLSFNGPIRMGTGLYVEGSTSQNITLTNSFVTNRVTGVNFRRGLRGDQNDTNLNVHCTLIQDNTTGVTAGYRSTDQSYNPDVTLSYSWIADNSLAVYRADTWELIDPGPPPIWIITDGITLIAEYNYWGAFDGPSNLGGSGDSYSGNVDADPFLNFVPLCVAGDFGDLPVDYDLTVRADDGARHGESYLHLGNKLDIEFNGQESADAGRTAADGDDGIGDLDEDGIRAAGTVWFEGIDGGAVTVTVSGGRGCLSGWIDWNDNNSMADLGDRIMDRVPVTGTGVLSFTIPAGAFPVDGYYDRFSRFRLGPDTSVQGNCSDDAVIGVTGPVQGGEIEDHYLHFLVDQINEAPVMNPVGDKVVDELTLLSFTVSAADPDIPVDQLTFSLDPVPPAGAGIGPTTGIFNWIPSEAQGPGVYTVTIRVVDDGRPTMSDTETIRITVNEVNIAPTATNDVYTTNEDIALVVVAPGLLNNDTDVDLPPNLLTTIMDVAPATGTLLLSTDGSFTYTPAPDWNGVVTFTYHISDGLAVSNIAVVTINVIPICDYLAQLIPPTDTASADPGTDVVYTLGITNAGDCGDTFDVSVLSIWPISAPAVVGPLGEGLGTNIDVTVTVPADAQCGDYDVATVTLTSQNDLAITRSSILTTTANTIYGVAADPPVDSATGSAGSNVVYTLTVTNTGNCLDTMDVALAGNVWATVAPATVGPLAGGISATLNVTVTIPAGADCTQSDRVTVTVTSQADGTKMAASELTTGLTTYAGVTVDPPADALADDPGMDVVYTLWVTNTGNCTDTLDITTTSVWPIVAPATVGPFGAGVATSVNVTVTIPADALCGDDDIATVTFTSQSDSGIADSTALTTSANTVRGVLAGPDIALAGDPGTDVVYTLEVTNTGNCVDTLNVSVVSLWPAVPSAAGVGPLGVGAGTTIQVTVTVPLDAQCGDDDIAAVTFTSRGDGSTADSTALTTSANTVRGVLAGPDIVLSGDPGADVAYTLWVTNTGNCIDTLNVATVSIWPIVAPATVGPLGVGAGTTIQVTVTVPLDAQCGDDDIATVTFTSQGDGTTADSTNLATSANTVRGVLAGPDVALAGDPGTDVVYTLWVTNTGNCVDTLDVSVVSLWPAVPSAAGVGPLGVGAGTTIQVTVTVPFDAQCSDNDIATVTFTSQGDGTTADASNLTTSVNTVRGVLAGPDVALSGDPGMDVVYTLWVTNTGNCVDTLNVSVASLWPAVPSATTVGPLAVGTGATIQVTVTVPLDAQCGDDDIATVTFTSQGDGTTADSTNLATSANTVRGVLAGPDVALSGDPGTDVVYTLWVTNTGNCVDTLDVSVVSLWPAVPSATTVGPLGVGAGTTIQVTVTIPLDALCGDNDIATVTFTSQGDGTTADSTNLATSANTVRGVNLTPPTDALAGDPGMAVVYTLWVTNTGNCADTFDVSLAGNTWATVAPPTVGPLAAGVATSFNVTVTVPAGAQCGDEDMVTVTTTSQGDGATADASDLTTAANTVRGVLAGPDIVLSGDPGMAVVYTLWVTNTGNCVDTLNVSVASLWPAVPSATTVGPLGVGAGTTIQVTVTVPLDAQCGDNDVATVTFTSQGDGTTADSTNLATSANTVRGVLAGPDVALAGDPGATVVYTLGVTNTGTCVDTFDVGVASLWPAVPSATAVGPLGVGAGTTIRVTVTIPFDARCGDADTTTVTFTSQGNGTTADSTNLTTAVNATYGITADPPADAQSGNVGTTVTYTLWLTNTGNCTDTLDVAVTALWPTAAPATVGPLGAGQSTAISVTVDIPAGANDGDYDVATLVWTSQGNGGVSLTNVLTTTAVVPCVPVSDAQFFWTPLTPGPGQVVTFTASVQGSPPLIYDWNFGDGGSGSGMVVTHSYAVAGNYTVTLVVENGCGLTSAVHNLTVQEVLPGHYTLYLPLVPRTLKSPPGNYTIYLPLVLKGSMFAPDLVIESLVVTENNVALVLRNRGNALIAASFWVDVYVDPDLPPTGVNQVWKDLGSEGLVWGITPDLLPVLPGEAIVLTLNDSHFWPDLSHVEWPIEIGTPTYGQVDSYYLVTNYGTVRENHEILGGLYNNILGPVYAEAGTDGVPTPVFGSNPPSSSGLPPRP